MATKGRPARKKTTTATKPATLTASPKIGLVSSIDFQSTKAQAAFQAGLGSITGLTYAYRDKVGFNRTKIANVINKLSSDQSVSLIVTVGGLITCNEAVMNSTKPFISLIGWLPNSPFSQPANSSLFRGCVTLDSPTATNNQNRISYIHNNWGVPIPDIVLLYDPDTAMATQELANWAGGTPVPLDSSNPGSFSDTFDNLPNAVQAVVISAAPAHHKHREQLISAANKWGQYVCYPLLSYANTGGNNQPTSGKALTYGPDLDGMITTAPGAYYQLGQMAATIIGGSNPSTLVVSVLQGNPNPL
jgi:hypothetical protein